MQMLSCFNKDLQNLFVIILLLVLSNCESAWGISSI